jgi:hypothetical protein
VEKLQGIELGRSLSSKRMGVVCCKCMILFSLFFFYLHDHYFRLAWVTWVMDGTELELYLNVLLLEPTVLEDAERAAARSSTWLHDVAFAWKLHFILIQRKLCSFLLSGTKPRIASLCHIKPFTLLYACYIIKSYILLYVIIKFSFSESSAPFCSQVFVPRKTVAFGQFWQLRHSFLVSGRYFDRGSLIGSFILLV